MIEYRLFNYDKDADHVIDLINSNLNKNYDLNLLRWKHFDNPSGKSTGAVAVSGNKIIAVVFYMHYIIFSKNMKMIKCARPVDGCTDIAYRRKGIFKRLMKFTLSEFGENYKLLFANPNRFSYPEFLKMSWSKYNSSYYNIGIPNFFKNRGRNIIKEISFDKENKNVELSQKEKFLIWRFKLIKYKLRKYLINNKCIVYVAYRKTKLRGIKILILCDFIGDTKYLSEIICMLCRDENSYFIYYLNNNSNNDLDLIIEKKHKPAIAVYSHSASEILNEIRFSLADLEGTT